MRVFITGAGGYIGHAVAKAFREKGHTVYGLVRNQEQADLLSLSEIWPIMGDLDKPESYKDVLKEVEVFVNCAFDSSDNGVERDRKTIETVLDSFSKSPLAHAFIYTSGSWVYGSTGAKVVDEASSVNPLDLVKWRPEHEQKVLKATSPNLRTVVIRPGLVYGKKAGLLGTLFTSAENGSVAIPSDGKNFWAMVHVVDLAHAYVSAAEKELTNTILNVVDDANPMVQDIALAISKAAGKEGQIQILSPEEAQKQFGALLPGYTVSQKINNARIKRLLGWQIHHASFIDDVDIYYHSWKASQQVEEF